ncbi:MAG: lysine--tRNA ligase [Bacteroidota bacterium]
MSALSEQEILRREKKASLEKLGINPYPSSHFAGNTTAEAISVGYRANPEKFKNVMLAGRIMTRRIMGAASFAVLQDDTGQVQLYLHRDRLCPGEDKTLYNQVFKRLLDIGDIIGVQGHVFITKTDALAISVSQLTLLTKSLKPLPVVKEVQDEEGTRVYDAFTDPEQRYRQRYVDLIVNPEVKAIFRKRALLIKTIRGHFDGQDYLEVETPILQPLYGGASARPFTTYHNTLEMPLYLRIANELYLKRLVVGGFKGVYEFAKDFRNEGMSRFHNPEFTQLEVYVAYRDYRWMMDELEVIIEKVALALHGTRQVQVGGHVIDFKRPWKRLTMFEVIKQFTQIDISDMQEEALREVAKKLNIALPDHAGKGKIIDEIFGSECEPHLIQPTLITDYPIAMSPLAKQHGDNADLVERFELICNGKEVANAFSELNDPIVQRARFEAQKQLALRGDEEAMALDEDFLQALAYGMPPTAGMGIGIDRLTMLMTNVQSIQEVIFFPQMRRAKEV